MIKSPEHAIKLARKNPHQTNTLRVLCLCSVGMLRSPTLANELNRIHGLNTRSCGVTTSHALVPVSEALLHWADELVFVDFDAYNEFTENDNNKNVLNMLRNQGTVVYVLNVPDVYDWNDTELKTISVNQYFERKKFMMEIE
mgnify:CR=1 FL=1